MKKGLFIVLDGNDGSGKATQSELLAQSLLKDSIPSEKIDFPGYDRNFFGKFVGECLAGKHGDFVHMDPKIASSLYALDRLESAPKIRVALEEGKVLIADRFSSSNQIHQGGKIADETERVAFLKWLAEMEHQVLNIPKPDAIIYLKVPLEISLKLLSEKRKAKNGGLMDGEKDTVEEDRNYLERSHETANWLASHEPNWHIVDCVKDGAMRTREDIHAEINEIVSRLLASLNIPE
jgi:dTMP kinase